MPARCARAAREVFRRARLDWLAGATGEALYDRADAYAREYGCALVREIPGHRVSDFPHALYGKHKLAHADFAPADGIWVLEIRCATWRCRSAPSMKTCCCARPEATRADLQPDRYAQASARPLRFRQIVALQSGSCGSTSRFNCSSDSCQPR